MMPDKVTEHDANLEFDIDIPPLTEPRHLLEPLIKVHVVACYSSGTGDRMYARNGDPGDQGDPPEVEIIHVYEPDAEEVDLLPSLAPDTIDYLVTQALSEGACQWGSGIDDCPVEYDDMRDMDDPLSDD